MSVGLGSFPHMVSGAPRHRRVGCSRHPFRREPAVHPNSRGEECADRAPFSDADDGHRVADGTTLVRSLLRVVSRSGRQRRRDSGIRAQESSDRSDDAGASQRRDVSEGARSRLRRGNAAAVADARQRRHAGLGEGAARSRILRRQDQSAAGQSRGLHRSLQVATEQPAPARTPKPMSGAQLFRTHCASCHGEHAEGAGPISAQLRNAVPDLTTYSARNGGMFPAERVRQMIEGRGPAAHGDRSMPIWGNAFRGQDSDADAAMRIDAIVNFLRSIQLRPAE
jgi:mono/diheme cytochrome c family protein